MRLFTNWRKENFNMRLTERKRNSDGTGVAKQNLIKDNGIRFTDEVLTKLAEYEDLEEQGRLIKLPCKVGTDIYYILGIPNETPCTIDSCVFELSDIHKIGKTLFLTREEAEAKLEELRGEKE